MFNGLSLSNCAYILVKDNLLCRLVSLYCLACEKNKSDEFVSSFYNYYVFCEKRLKNPQKLT